MVFEIRPISPATENVPFCVSLIGASGWVPSVTSDNPPCDFEGDTKYRVTVEVERHTMATKAKQGQVISVCQPSLLMMRYP